MFLVNKEKVIINDIPILYHTISNVMGWTILTDQDSNRKTHKPMDRRKFMKNTGLLAGGVVGGSVLGGLFTNQFRSQPETLPAKEAEIPFQDARMFFTRWEDFSALREATESIYPEDDQGPGAIELGVPYFIDKQLAGSWGLNAKEYMQAPFILDEPSRNVPKNITNQPKQSQGGPDAETKSSTPLPRYESGLNRGEIFIQGIRKMREVSTATFDEEIESLDEDQTTMLLQLFENGEVDMEGVSSVTFFHFLLQATLEGVYSDPLYGGNKDMMGWKMAEYPGPRPGYIDVIQEENFIKMDPFSLRDYQQS